MIKSMLITSLKFIFAISIIVWMIYNGKLDFSILTSSLQYKTAWAIGFFIMILNILLTTVRWKILLEIKSSTTLRLSTMTRLTWIGVFFSSVLPGIVTGDVVKLVYAKDLDKNLSKTYLLTSALMDRIIGLIGLLLLIGLSSAIYYNTLVAKGEHVANLVHLNFVIFFGVILFILAIILPVKIQNYIHTLLKKIPIVGNLISRVSYAIWDIGKSPKALGYSIAISLVVQTLNVFAFWALATPFIEGTILTFEHALSFIPLGFVTIAIPISPAGIGVGHAAFDQLFSLYGINNGASLFNLYFICWITINLFGVIPYLMSSKKYSVKDASGFDK